MEKTNCELVPIYVQYRSIVLQVLKTLEKIKDEADPDEFQRLKDGVSLLEDTLFVDDVLEFHRLIVKLGKLGEKLYNNSLKYKHIEKDLKDSYEFI